jgi:hypothetical protein
LSETLAAKIGFLQVVGLQENAHRAVNDEDALAGCGIERSENVFRHG